jgi:hypothetical protein
MDEKMAGFQVYKNRASTFTLLSLLAVGADATVPKDAMLS